ncbi:MAG: DUF1800 family protein, partial [Alphaproteobacteria bacterium]
MIGLRPVRDRIVREAYANQPGSQRPYRRTTLLPQGYLATLVLGTAFVLGISTKSSIRDLFSVSVRARCVAKARAVSLETRNMDEAIVSHAQKRRLAEIITAIMTSRFDNATAADRQRCNRKLSLWIASLAIVVLLALPATPLSAMTLADARHFAQRIGFAATPDEVMRLLPMTRDQAIADILERTRVQPVTAAPTWAGGTIDLRVPKGTPEQRREFLRQQRLETLELRAWWYREMLTTPSPLTERMTLFWHNHFATSVRKVRSAALMYRQNQLLRSHAVGSFRSLLAAIPRDPAMILWLDGVANRRDRPNENFARELLELFALGEGKIYTEQDIKEAARAFTGWSIDRANGEFRFRRLAHDDGAKKFLGKRGPFNGDDIIDVLLDHPRTAEYIVEKLWREFVSETPDPIEVRRIAARFKARNYDIKTALGELFGVPAFWAPESRGRLVRS